jgi:hypothetical protein
MTPAGLPTATTLAGRSLVTTAPAPTTVFSPMPTRGRPAGPIGAAGPVDLAALAAVLTVAGALTGGPVEAVLVR